MLPPQEMGPQLPPEAMMGGAPPMGPPPMGPPPAPEGGGESTTDILEQMIELSKLYIETDEDEEDKLTMTKVLQILQKYLADEQKEAQDAMSGKLSPKIMARAYGGG
jgi:hypothetical protein